MTSMVDRIIAVNKQVWDEWPAPIDAANVGDVRRASAQAVIKAMREPTHGMTAKACNALKRHIDSFTEAEREQRWPGRKDDNGWRVPNKEKHRVRYQAMVDAALGASVIGDQGETK